MKYLLVSSAHNLCKQIGPTDQDRQIWIQSVFDTLMVFLKEFFKQVDFEKNQQTTNKHEKFLRGQRVKKEVTF